MPAQPENATVSLLSFGSFYGRECSSVSEPTKEIIAGGKDCAEIESVSQSTSGSLAQFEFKLGAPGSVYQIAFKVVFTTPPTEMPVISGVSR